MTTSTVTEIVQDRLETRRSQGLWLRSLWKTVQRQNPPEHIEKQILKTSASANLNQANNFKIVISILTRASVSIRLLYQDMASDDRPFCLDEPTTVKAVNLCDHLPHHRRAWKCRSLDKLSADDVREAASSAGLQWPSSARSDESTIDVDAFEAMRRPQPKIHKWFNHIFFSRFF